MQIVYIQAHNIVLNLCYSNKKLHTDPKSSPNDHTNSSPLITGVVIAIFVLLAVMILFVVNNKDTAI